TVGCRQNGSRQVPSWTPNNNAFTARHECPGGHSRQETGVRGKKTGVRGTSAVATDTRRGTCGAAAAHRGEPSARSRAAECAVAVRPADRAGEDPHDDMPEAPARCLACASLTWPASGLLSVSPVPATTG